MKRFRCRYILNNRYYEEIISANDFYSAKLKIESQYKNGNSRFNWSRLPEEV